MKKLKKFVSGLVQNNRVVMALSLIVSFFIWFAIAQSDSQFTTRTLTNVPVNLDLSNTALSSLGLEIFSDGTVSADVKISGRSSTIYSVSADDIIVTPSVSGITAAGEYDVRLSASRKSAFAGFEVDSVLPGTVRLHFDSSLTRSFTVTAKAVGASAPNGLVAETAVVSDQSNTTIELTGPATQINSIASVEVRADVNDVVKSTASYDGKVVLLDNDGKQISSKFITMSFTEAEITVPISKMKDVPVVPTFLGAPSNNPVVATPEVSKITVIGQPDIIDGITKAELSPIDMSQVTKSGTYECDIVLPTGVRSADGLAKVKVSLNVRDCTSRTFTVTNFSPSKVPAGKSVKLSKPVSVTVTGTSSQISRLTAANLTVSVDMSNYLTAGTYEVAATLKVSGQSSVWVTGQNYTAVVTVQ